jgi:hypothetical protein
MHQQHEQQEKAVAEALELLAEGEMARAAKRLCSLGVCDGGWMSSNGSWR